MRCWGLAAVAVAMTISTAAAATGGSLLPAGLVDAADAGEASIAALDRPGFRLLPELRLRLNVTDRLADVVRGASPMRTQLVDIRRHRRMGMMVDYFPASDGGFFLSAGIRKLPGQGRRWTAGSTLGTMSHILAPMKLESLRVGSNIARRAPAMMAGWTGLIGRDATLGLAAGALQERGRTLRYGTGALGRALTDNARWSRIGALAQVSFGVRF